MNIQNYIIASVKPWSREIFENYKLSFPGNWLFFDKPDELKNDFLKKFLPRFIFFLHWNSKVPENIINNFECVCFHMTDVPYGRGGCPLQNLIIRKHRDTKLSALRMVKNLDAGPVYLKRDLCLEGSAEEIYIRATYLSFEMIKEIIDTNPKPLEQVGVPVYFKRRTPEESEILQVKSLQSFYDFIRMLDADGYPKGFIDYKGYRLEFSRAALYNGRIHADVVIKPKPKES